MTDALADIIKRIETKLAGCEPHDWPVPASKDDLRALIDKVKLLTSESYAAEIAAGIVELSSAKGLVLVPIALIRRLGLIDDAAVKLYRAAQWTAATLPPAEQAKLWEDLRDALGLAPGGSNKDILPPTGSRAEGERFAQEDMRRERAYRDGVAA